MAWIGIYTDQAAVFRRLDGKLLPETFSSGPASARIVEDDLFEQIANQAEAYLTSALSGLNYKIPLTLTSSSTRSVLAEATEKHIGAELLRVVPSLKDFYGDCCQDDEALAELASEYESAIAKLCDEISACRIRLDGEIRDPDPCQSGAVTFADGDQVGPVAVTSRDEPGRFYKEPLYTRRRPRPPHWARPGDRPGVF